MIHSEAALAKNSTWILVFIGIKECTRCWWCNWKIASEPGQAWGPLLGQESPGECFSFVLPLFSGRAWGSPVGIDHLVVYGLQPGMPSSHFMSITWSFLQYPYNGMQNEPIFRYSLHMNNLSIDFTLKFSQSFRVFAEASFSWNPLIFHQIAFVAKF